MTDILESTVVVLCRAAPGQDEIFVAWFREVHAQEMLAIDGIVGVTAYRAVDDQSGAAGHPFVVEYDVRGRTADDVLADVDDRIRSGRMALDSSFSLEDRARGVYLRFCAERERAASEPT